TEAIAELSKNGGIEEKVYTNINRSNAHQYANDLNRGGKSEYIDGQHVMTIDHTEELAKKELELLQLQQKRAEAVSLVNKRIAEQSLAYLEVDGTLSKLSESQIRAIEDYSQAHTKSINKRLDELVEEGATQEQIADFLEKKGDNIATKASQIGEAYTNAFKTVFELTDGSQSSMKNVRSAIDAVSDSLDENFYKWKDVDTINRQLEELTKISYDMQTAGVESFDSYIERVMSFGYEVDEATQIVGEMAKEQKNAEIYQEAMKKGFEETTEAIEGYNDALLETIDVTATLLGEGASDEMKAVECNLALIMLYNKELGDGAKEHWEYNEAVKNTTMSLGLSEETIDKNAEKIAFLTNITRELNPALNETADGVTAFNTLSDEQTEKLKKLGISQDDLLKKYI